MSSDAAKEIEENMAKNERIFMYIYLGKDIFKYPSLICPIKLYSLKCFRMENSGLYSENLRNHMHVKISMYTENLLYTN